jgi:hypothetical protein
VRRRILTVLACGLAVGAAFCAKPYAPTGGTPDRRAPEIVATIPERLAIVPNFNGAVVIRFNERISERGADETAVLVSPETGRVHVSHTRTEIRVRIDGGWQPNQIYRVVLLPTVRDLFSNQRKEPVDVVFSTGPTIPSTTVAGLLISRLTNKPVPDARVEAVRRAGSDSTVYVTVTDTAGFFALRYMAPGPYGIHAYVDQNRNKKVDLQELQVDTAATLATARDTVLLTLTMLPHDTTPARLVRAEARDSMQVRLSLDDYVDPTNLVGVSARVLRLPDSSSIPVMKVVGPRGFDSLMIALRAERAAAADTSRARAPNPPRTPTDTASALPTQELVLVPAVALTPKTRYRVEIAGLTNIVGLKGGGGAVNFETPAPPPAAPARRPNPPIGPRSDTTGGRTRPDTTKIKR